MNRINYVQSLQELLNDVRIMGVNLEDTLDKVIQNLKEQNQEVAQQIIANDDMFDNSELEIEKKCIDLVLRQAPVASDWREIASVLKLVGDLERIADQCSDISQYTLHLSGKPKAALPSDLIYMFQVTRTMVYDSLTSMDEKDADLAQKVIDTDEQVDKYFYDLREQLTATMQQNPELVPQYVDYLMISKYIERIADHATNIAEWVIYIVRNELKA